MTDVSWPLPGGPQGRAAGGVLWASWKDDSRMKLPEASTGPYVPRVAGKAMGAAPA